MSVTKDSSKPIKPRFVTIIILLGVVLLWFGFRVIFPDSPTLFVGTPPNNLGIIEGKLAVCPSTPNCVSSQSQDPEHLIAPFSYQGNTSEAIASLKKIINQQEKSKIIAENDQYLYAQFTSQWMGFVDDVEFFVNPEKSIIDVRSASRLGESDLGVNRQRIEKIRQAYK